MTEIKNVFVTVRMPRGKDPGKVEEGHYRVEGDVVTLVTVNGTPRYGHAGKPLTRKLTAGELNARRLIG